MAKNLTVKVYDQEGKETGSTKLDPTVFAVEINEDLVQQAALVQMANSRTVLAHAKARSEVRGGGKKPWRQKGTGRARHGSIRSPLWRGGGITFGPDKNRNFSKKINKQARRKAICSVLTDKAQNKAIVVIDGLKLAKIKTKDLLQIINKLPSAQKKSLIVLPKANQTIWRSAKNVKNLETILADSLNVVTLLNYDFLIIVKASLKKISTTFSK